MGIYHSIIMIMNTLFLISTAPHRKIMQVSKHQAPYNLKVRSSCRDDGYRSSNQLPDE
jgi:hypothetical protein